MQVWCGTNKTEGNITTSAGYWIDHRRLRRNKRRFKQGKSVMLPQWIGSIWIHGLLPGEPSRNFTTTQGESDSPVRLMEIRG